ncbi:MAG: hypothetical protein P8183_08450, partial [Anaerolineae bacterium]
MVSLQLLGPFRAETEDGTAVSLRRKSRAVLAYLAAAERPYTRHELASLFCQSAADPNQTLRLILSRLRRVVGEAALLTEGNTVHLDSELCPVDLQPFAQTLEQPDLSQVSSEALAQVVTRYRGEFLAGLHLPDAPEFEMWLVGQRSRWRQLYERGALAWLHRLIADGQLSQALPLAQKLVQH